MVEYINSVYITVIKCPFCGGRSKYLRRVGYNKWLMKCEGDCKAEWTGQEYE